ncbi:hypothetical protein AB4Y33_43445, partial [Paraburkholderia sp. BR14319]|uniref:hypothetical protein n=1 Tax=Paraburkholderia sp. BR14319 TaxID=3237005 RepID=UPI0034D2402E
MRDLFILILLAAVFTIGKALVRVENERYALWLGMCPNMRETVAGIAAQNPSALNKCTVETRTAWWWHLY